MELSLLDCDNYLTYKPSKIAASSLFLAAHIVPYNDVKLTDIEKVCEYKSFQDLKKIKQLFDRLT